MYIFTSKLGALWFWYTSSIVAPRPSFTICCTICVCVCLYCAHTWRGYRSFRTRFSQNGQLIVVSQFNGMTWDNDLVVSAPQDNIFFFSFFFLSFFPLIPIHNLFSFVASSSALSCAGVFLHYPLVPSRRRRVVFFRRIFPCR